MKFGPIHIKILIFIVLVAGVRIAQADPSWLSRDWNYRAILSINNSAYFETLQNYNVRLVLDATNPVFSQIAPQGRDLRFTAADGITPLGFWIQSWDSQAQNAVIWVKVPSLVGGAVTQIYMYFGNAAATSGSDGTATFSIFSDFNETFDVVSRSQFPNLGHIACAPEVPTPIIPLGASGDYDHWGYRESGNVLVDTLDPDPSRRYKMWYSVQHDSLYTSDRTSWLAYAYSADGRNWVKQGRVSTQFYGEDPYVARVGNTYFLFFESKLDPHWDRIMLMTSTDAVNWTGQGVVVPPQPTLNWMDLSPSSPTLWIDYGAVDTTWYLFFEGKGTGINRGGGNIGLSTSHDGYHFQVYGTTPIFDLGTPGTWDDGAMVPDNITKIGNTYWMTYHGLSYSPSTPFIAGYASSPDLIHWTRASAISGNVSITPMADPQFFWDLDGSLAGTGYVQAIYRVYPYIRNPAAWPSNSPWQLQQMGSQFGLANAAGGTLTLSGEGFVRSSSNLVSTQRFTNGFEVVMRSRYANYGNRPYASVAIGSGNLVDMNLGTYSQWEITVLQSGYAWCLLNDARIVSMPASGGKHTLYSWNLPPTLAQNFSVQRFVYDNLDSLKWFFNDTLRSATLDHQWSANSKRILISQGEYSNTGDGGLQAIDWIYVRPCINREPIVTVGPRETQHALFVTSPAGGEQWYVGDTVRVRWNALNMINPLAMLLIRADIPFGWELLADNINPLLGEWPVVVDGPPSAHCYIHLFEIGGTSVSSSGEFVVAPQMRITAPVAGARWTVNEPSLVEWQITGYDGNVQISLNRNYPSGNWEILAQNVPNTGQTVVSAGMPVSVHCRLRISAMNDPYSWISDSDFILESPRGFLALIDPEQPETALTTWDGGVRECRGAAGDTLYFRNFGDQSCVASIASPPNAVNFSNVSNCGGAMSLQPGEISSCFIVIGTNPFAASGVINDSFAIQTDAANHDATGRLWIHLKATIVTTPKPPVVTIAVSDTGLALWWSPVMSSVHDCSVSEPYYLVLRAPSLNASYTLLGITADTSFTLAAPTTAATERWYYDVRAYVGDYFGLAKLKVGDGGSSADDVSRILNPQ